jgi:hypothetical protein
MPQRPRTPSRLATIARSAPTVLAAILSATEARADPPIPRRPAPLVLPDLSHERFDARLDWTLAGILPERTDRPYAAAGITRFSMEAAILRQRLYLGTTGAFASALPPDGGLAQDEHSTPGPARRLFSNVESHIRMVFRLPTYIELGFLLAVVAPTATFDREARSNRSASEAVASLDPTSYVHFLPGRIALRTGGDVRFVRGSVVVQGRHGFDVVIDDAGIESARLAGRLLGHVGYLVNPRFEIGLDGSQIYVFAADPKTTDRFADQYRISDAHRSSLTFGPTVRWALPDVDIGAGLVTNASRPLSPAAESFLGLTVSVIAHLGR